MDTAQWSQEIVVKPLEEIVTNTCPKPQPPQPQPPQTVATAVGDIRKARPEKDQAINCPRCNSINTKFCYYNNYSLTQPRYFCKGCRRYWTEGGSLRNIPVGGGSRKNKRSHHHHHNYSSDSTQQATKKQHVSDHNNNNHFMNMSQQGLTSQSQQNPNKFLEPTQQDLSLGFPPHGLVRTNFTNNTTPLLVSTCSATSATTSDLIRSNNNGNNNNVSSSSFLGFPLDDDDQDPTLSGGFSMQDHYKPCNTNTTLLGFSLDHHHHSNNSANNGFHGGLGGDDDDDVNVRHLFPFEDLKLHVSSSSTSTNNVDIINDHEKRASGGDGAATSSGYWSGMLSGGSSWC
ncbi:unnamed protein product [Cochlearia groenlandica]